MGASLSMLMSCSPQDFQSVLGTAGAPPALTNDEVIAGLKEALRLGTERTVGRVGATDGFWSNALIRIPFPQEAINVKNTLTDLGITKPVEDFERTLNTAAERASKEAVPVFVDAITSMSIADGFAILRGGERAATDYLREKTSGALRARFTPVVQRATQEVALTSHWQPVATAYNAATLLTGGKAVNPDLNAYVTDKALDGLFAVLAQEEKRIRQDPVARTTALLQKVFGTP
ncbi:MAG: DUF4197 domain-containing protein [Flavobacteriales bacterium]|jgi:hypothetical protein|nr:MAG: DUF4197 domain-containing protein [Flavobacteriales bacterium]